MWEATFSQLCSESNIQFFPADLILSVAFLSAVSSGFDGALMSGINAMVQYSTFFGTKTTGSVTGVVFAMVRSKAASFVRYPLP
jgi:hypothetical protein